MSLVTQKLCESGGIRYNVWRDRLLRQYRRLKFGKVYETSTSITDFPYRYSFHAIMYVYRSGYDMEWATGMDEIYSNIVNKAEEKVLRSVVMPLLGSGRAGVPVEVAINVLLNSLSTKSRDHLKEVHLAVVDKKIYDKVVKECQNLNSKPAPEPKEAWVSTELVVDLSAPTTSKNTNQRSPGFSDNKHGGRSLQSTFSNDNHTATLRGKLSKSAIDHTHGDTHSDHNSLISAHSKSRRSYKYDPEFQSLPSEAREKDVDNTRPTGRRDEPNSSGAIGDDVEPTGNNLASRRGSRTHEFQSLPNEARDNTRPTGRRDEPNSSGAVSDDVEPTGNNLASRRGSRTHEFQSLPNELRSARGEDADDTKPIGKRAESNTIGAVGGVGPTGNDWASASKAKHFTGYRRRDKSQKSGGSRHSGTGGDRNTSGTDDDEDVKKKMAMSVKDATTMSSTEADDTCPICMDSISNPKKLSKCGHVFCKDCIDRCFKTYNPVCPTCNTIYGEITGTQPEGNMTVKRDQYSHLPGHPDCGTITITYHFKGGIQGVMFGA
ncbi:uncharacterized protein LOC121377420 [Gigantopelta aegis]|uniref:uncharacterized protein LOC121377420 n=1 Tax=Gigantopelta aegis TaxID=1735272 RepID=UPI001B88D005|nr:uncharacterized protein LOC121377420 [Gigantopelta aegis]